MKKRQTRRTISVSAGIYDALSRLAATRDVTVTRLIDQVVRAELDDYGLTAPPLTPFLTRAQRDRTLMSRKKRPARRLA